MRFETYKSLVQYLKNVEDAAQYLPQDLHHCTPELLGTFDEKTNFPVGCYEGGNTFEGESDTSGATTCNQGISFTLFSVDTVALSGDKQGLRFADWIQKHFNDWLNVNHKAEGFTIYYGTIAEDITEQDVKRSVDAGRIVWRTTKAWDLLVEYPAGA